MSASVPASFSPRQTILDHAIRLRERIVAGECPYPDAAMEANENFIARLEDSHGDDVAAIAAAQEKKVASRDSVIAVLAGIGGVGALAMGIYCIACPPLIGSAVLAGSAALAVRTLFAMRRKVMAETEPARTFAGHLRNWSDWASSDAPRVPSWKDPMSVNDLKILTNTFPEDVKEFPYATELTAAHNRLLAALPADKDTPLSTVKADFLAHPRRSPQPLLRLGSATAKLLRNVGWIGGAASLAAGQPWLAGALFGSMALGVGMQFGISRLGGKLEGERDGLKLARSIHYWEQSMASAPAVGAESLVFGTDPRNKDLSITRSQEDVKIGAVVVPVKRRHGHGTDEAHDKTQPAPGQVAP